jgi:glycine/D-amino acid oxidase-like deaminating enzyme
MLSIDPALTSWWLDEALANEAPAADGGPLEGEHRAGIVIVGGGYTGLWTALALRERRPSLSIALIEAKICGAGASGMNGGKVHGYWSSLPRLVEAFRDEVALRIASAGSTAQAAIRAFAGGRGRDLWWREAGHIKVSAAPAQDAKIERYWATARRLGVSEAAIPLVPKDVRARCASPVFRSGVYFPEGALIHPARLARALRRAALDAGIRIFEHTRMTGLEPGTPNIVVTPRGRLIARDVVLATNAALAGQLGVREHLTNFSSYALMTEPVPERLKSVGWIGHEGISDARMFVHYFRTTPDGRVLMGSGSGPIGYGGKLDPARFAIDRASAARAEAGLRRLLPALQAARIERIWGGPIDVSSDHLPFFRRLPGTRIHYGCGYSGHGVNATWIGGQCLASLVLDLDNEWTRLPFCTRPLPTLPPEPLRYIGGSAVRAAILACETAEERDQVPPGWARAIAALPKVFHLRIGTR